jgi:methionyl-tRNA formyltransferase
MRIAFLGTPAFAVPSLEALAREGFEIPAVFTQPDRPKGRGQQLAISPVKEAALRLGLAVHQPERVRRPEVLELLRGMALEAMVVVGYGQIIPQSIIELVPLGIINVAPIQWAIAKGETRTGVTTMRIDAGLDTGDMLLKAETEIGPEETAPELSARLAEVGARLLIETMASTTIVPEKQDHSQHSLAPILKKEDGLIDWRQPAARIHARARGFQPWPGAYTTFRGQTLHIWKCTVAPAPAGAPGTLMLQDRKRILVACGEGTALELQEMQIQGRNRVDAASFRNGQRIDDNERLGESAS